MSSERSQSPGLLRRAATAPIRVWTRIISPLMPPRCRYEPSCSRYATQAIEELGIIRGSVLAAWRLLRCNPWSPGGIDRVSERRLFRPEPMTPADTVHNR
ncbi:MAG: membrane protein insertion efficiency factor YidD [Alsobacter sp.]